MGLQAAHQKRYHRPDLAERGVGIDLELGCAQAPSDGLPFNPNTDCQSPARVVCLKTNVKWDSNGLGVALGDGAWEVTATDGGGNALSQPVRFNVSSANSKWYYVVFTSRP